MIVQSSFRPAWWLRNAHLQTLYPALFRRQPLPLSLKRERLNTPDNDFVDIDWCGDGDKPIVILLHGLAGCSRSSYIVGLQHMLLQHGVRSVTLNFRGCSGEPNQLARGYHSGDTGDVDFLFQTLLQREPETPFAVIGISLGGNVLLKWLGEQGHNLAIAAAVAVSVPLDLASCATRLDHGFSKIYRHNLIGRLKHYTRKKQQYLEDSGKMVEAAKIQKLGDLSKIRSFWQYDDRVVSRLHGFKDVEQYYRLSSSRQYLKRIRIPTLVIQARDDPFMTEKVIPGSEELSSSVTLEVSSSGGHVGFISGNNPLKPRYWLDERISQFLHQYGIL